MSEACVLSRIRPAAASLGALVLVACSHPAFTGDASRLSKPCGRAVIEHHDALCFAEGRMTVEAWVRPEPAGGWPRIVSKYGHTAAGRQANRLRAWELAIKDTGVLFFRAVPASDDGAAKWFSIESKTRIPMNEWTHVAVALDGPAGELRVYVNGRLDAQREVKLAGLQVNPGQDLHIGVYAGYDAHRFKGLIDELRLTARALAFDGRPATPYTGREPGTVALYHFDRQAPGGVLVNAAARDRHPAALVDGELPVLTPSMPGFGQALRLTGADMAGVVMKRYPFKRLPHPTLEELGRLCQGWRRRYPKRVRAEVLGKGSDGLPVHMLTISDLTVPDDDKEVVLMAGMHVGGELSGGTSLLAFAEWLLGDDEQAAEIRRKQTCVIVPVANPYGYGKSAGNRWGHDTAWSWSAQGATHVGENPEGVLIQKLIDRLQPEVFVDSHGTVLEGQYMGEFLGTSGASLILNTFQGSLVREMARAAGKVGFPQHLGAESHEKILVSEPVPGCTHEFFVYPLGNRVNAPLYAYIRHHAIPMTMESGGWSGSAVSRLRRLMEIGCRRWPTEPCAGYPNRRISSPVAWMQWLAAYGRTASARRASRVELWRKQTQIVRFASYPDMDRAFLYGAALTPAGVRTAFRAAGRRSARVSMGRLLLNLKRVPGMNVDAIRSHLEATGCLSLRTDPLPAPDTPAAPIRHGLALRSLIPYANPRITDVRLNGNPIDVSAEAGYQVWQGNGGTYIQVNIPPDQVRDVHVVTCRYDPGEARTWGFTPKRF